MKCPACGEHFEIEDWHSDAPFECPECGARLRLVADESTYQGATDSRLEIAEDDG
jgi:predicted nucleic acid-binding Zn ribbon protein